MSKAITNGIQITVHPEYLESESEPAVHFWLYVYRVKIENTSKNQVQLLRRHWIITNGLGDIEEVKGDGVVGKQPILNPGESFQYTSGCPMKTPIGSMHGTYTFQNTNGDTFDANIEPFLLEDPTRSN
jgi:ApaG protein